MSATAKKSIYYPVLFAPDEFSDLQKLAATHGRTKADVIRRLVVQAAKTQPQEKPLITPSQVSAALK